ncbi:plasmid recombination protein [Rivibacter subsaxonicus]|nr:plasmid recombination protein [Rivibacter subsaxonicus]
MRMKKLPSTTLLPAARHNRRAIATENARSLRIDCSSSHRNIVLRGPDTPEAVVQFAKDLMAAGGARLVRKDAVACVEIVFSLPVRSEVDPASYFTACTEWAEAHFGCPVLSSDIHLDEAQPHCHVLLLPMVDGRMRGSSLVGDRQKLAEHHERFHADVASKFGLLRPPRRLQGNAKAQAAALVIDALKRRGDLVLGSKVWPEIRDMIEADPVSMVTALQVSLPPPLGRAKRSRTFTQIMISKGKGPSRERDAVPLTKAVGFQIGDKDKDRSLSCVGLAAPSASGIHLAIGASKAAAVRESTTPTPASGKSAPLVDAEPRLAFTRGRDEATGAACWDGDTGEINPRPAVSRELKACAQRSVDEALAALSRRRCLI